MTVYRDFDEVEFNPNTILTVGTFDGVHRGHQEIIKSLNTLAKERGLRPILLTIDPHPQIVLQRSDRAKIHLLSTIKERLELFEEYGVENVLVIPFTYEFSLTTPEEFIKKYLSEKIGLNTMLMGYDHSFGKDREGGAALITKLAAELNFKIEKVEPFSEKDIVVSSTKIRHALEEHKIEEANELLGHDYFVRGKVVHGNGRGAGLGYPTANIHPPDIYKQLPANGVYFASSVIAGEKYYGMANIGFRPTVTTDIKPTLEVHYFDFDDDIYGEEITTHFHKYVRNEVKFKNIDALLSQLEKDERTCRDFADNF